MGTTARFVRVLYTILGFVKHGARILDLRILVRLHVVGLRADVGAVVSQLMCLPMIMLQSQSFVPCIILTVIKLMISL